MKRVALTFVALLWAMLPSLYAELGLPREAFGVWDREGLHSVVSYPYARGQSVDMSWGRVQQGGKDSYDWSDIDVALASAEAQNQLITCKVSPIDSSAPNNSMPSWMFGPLTAAGGGLVAFSEVADPLRPTVIPAAYVYAKYTEPQFKVYFEAMVKQFAKKLRVDLTPSQQARIAFVRVDTGATGDEEPYENPSLIPSAYSISPAAWDEYRDWLFELYRKEFQDGPGRPIPLLFSAVEPVPDAPNLKWNWIVNNVKGGFGTKHGGQLRGHHLSESESNVTVYKPLAVDSDFKFFSRNEMDPTWTKPYFKLNVPLNMYWAALEQLNVGMSIWDWNGTCMENADGTLQQFFNNGNFVFTAEFFNKWAAELDPATAGGGFCVFHEGLDSSDTEKFPIGSGPGKYGNASWGNTARYTAICAAYASQGAQMDDLNGATMGSVAQRDDTPGMIGFNDAGWKIHSGNYDRFITQLDPDNTSKGLWRVGGPLTATSHPYDRFARRSDTASGKNTMYFDINDNLLPTIGQPVQINVTYRNDTPGQFLIKYDAVGNTLKTLTVNKTGLGTANEVWATASFEVTDWVFGNRQPTNTAPSGSDLQLVNVGPGDTIYHGIELIKMADVSVGIIGSGTVTGRNNTAVFSPLPSRVMEGQRLELKATPAPGWRFTGWSGALVGTTPHPFLFPAKDTRLTATFMYGLGGSADNFNLGTWADGSGWSDTWTSGTNSSGTVELLLVPAAMAQLSGGSGVAKITRTLDIPLTSATLSFDWDLDRIGGSDFATVEVYNGSAWIQVWRETNAGADVASTPNVVTSGNIRLTGTVFQVRFTLNANQTGDTFFVDNVSITGTPVIVPSIVPQFSSGPIAKTSATAGSAYLGSLSGSASDPNNNPLTFSKLPGGPSWLNIAADGTLSGTPSATDAGLNSWNVQVASSDGSDTAILLINVVALGPNPPSALTYPNTLLCTKGTGIRNIAPTSGGGSVMRYVASPRLPMGLYLNSTTGILSGTPTEVKATSTFTITASNADGSATAPVNITVNDIAPTALFYSSNPAIYKRGEVIAANIPANAGGDVVSYAILPALPSGLTLNSITGVISGTPLAPSLTPVIHRVIATNTGGSTFTDVSIQIDDANSNSAPIVINDDAAASPYPSTITVPTTAGTITKVIVQLKGLNHTQQNNLDLLLVGPSGQTVVLMSDVGGSADAANVDLTFDDAALASLTTTAAPILTGTYKPTNFAPTDVFSAPAPATATYGTTLSVFNGTNPTGTWSLYVVDDGLRNTGTLSGGWNLSFEILPAVVAAPSSLSYSINPAIYTMGVAMTSTPTSTGGAVTSYSISSLLPAGLTFNTTTGIINGTPTTITSATPYTVTAANSGGSTTVSLSISVVSAYTAWATQYNLVQGPTGDDDGDGNSNILEFVTGMVPTNATSVFKTAVSAVPGQPNQFAISFSPITSGRTYTVKSTESLTSGTWNALTGSTTSDVGSERTVIDTQANGGSKFYRVEIIIP